MNVKLDSGYGRQILLWQIAYKKKEAPETASGFHRNHHPTVVSSADGAKILKDIDNLILEYKEKSSHSKTFIGDVARAIKAERDGSGSEYATFLTINDRIITIRISNHNATVVNFDYKGENEGISIVITNNPNKGINKGGNAHIIEFFYDSIKLRKLDGKPLVEILQSLKQTLYSGVYKDTTGLAQREEVNAPFFKDKKGTIYGWTSNGKIYKVSFQKTPMSLA